MFVLKGIFGGSLNITSENENNFQGKKKPQKILREAAISATSRKRGKKRNKRGVCLVTVLKPTCIHLSPKTLLRLFFRNNLARQKKNPHEVIFMFVLKGIFGGSLK